MLQRINVTDDYNKNIFSCVIFTECVKCKLYTICLKLKKKSLTNKNNVFVPKVKYLYI